MKLKNLINASLTLILFTSLSPAFAAVHIIDVMVVYPHHATLVREGRDMPTRVALLIANANQSYKESKVNIRLRAVHLKEVAIPGTGNVSRRALFSLAGDQNIQKLREKHGADLVVLLTLKKIVGDGELCGLGYIAQGTNGKLTDNPPLYNGTKNGGFSVTGINCSIVIFVHEIGHNMGLDHPYEQNGSGGVFHWGRGHGKDFDFVTIMGYPKKFGNARHLLRFSSPTQIKCHGLPCGVFHNKIGAADAVTSLNAVAKQVSDFFPTKVPR
jgi:hypothetical protein